jgi:predicted HNH restriction endonuclease
LEYISVFSFSAVYGTSMEGFIHVHHLTPLHQVGRDYVVNPQTDLVPVCPNCHAVIHSSKPQFTINEVRQLMQSKDLRLAGKTIKFSA